MADPAEYRFLPWVRSGFRPNVETDPLTEPVAAPGEVSVDVTVAGEGDGTRTEAQAETRLRLYGPGDVTGIDERQVVRTEPEGGTTDFPPNYFPLVEFDRPDLPWLFSPAAATADGKLRPWACLVVVRDQEGVELETRAGLPRPTLRIEPPADPGDELPDPAESWAWAHAQVVGDPTDLATDEWVREQLSGRSPATISRLVAPRRLEPEEEYIACVVPTFDAGVAAGLGETPTGETVGPAWQVGPDLVRVRLPVYHHWTFSTGEAGDFESLVRRLQAATVPPGVGYRDLDVGRPGPSQLATDDPLVLGLGGALRSPTERDEPYPDRKRDALREILNTPNVLGETVGVPVLGPPIYGRWHAASPTVPDDGDPPRWLGDLDLDPRHRVAAGLGTVVVQEHQEALMASAWEQVGAIREANRLLRQAQLSRAASKATHRLLAATGDGGFDAAELLAFTGQVHARLAFEDGTVAARVSDSRLPEGALSPAFRRLARPRGPLASRLSRDDRPFDPADAVRRLNDGSISGDPVDDPPDGTDPLPEDLLDRLCEVATDRLAEAEDQVDPAVRRILERLALLHEEAFEQVEAIRDELETGEPEIDDALASLEEVCELARELARRLASLLADFPDAQEAVEELGELYEAAHDLLAALSFQIGEGDHEAAAETLAELEEVCERADDALDALRDRLPGADQVGGHLEPRLCDRGTVEPEPPALDLGRVADAVVSRLDPERTVPARVLDRIDAPADLADRPDPLAEVMAAPEFPEPMYEPLADRSQEHLLPGVEDVPRDSVTLVETNPEFVVAYLVGLNHEFGRELLWREYPTDQRGSYFRQFWDVRGRVPPPTTDEEREGAKDVDYLHRWSPDARLRELLRSGRGEGTLVLLVRGELLRRYPDTVVYAVKARWKDDAGPPDGDRVPLEDPTEGDPEEIRRPTFRGELDPDVTFLGFDLTESVARGDDGLGWFFVIEEPSGEPRFGFDEADEADFGATPPGMTTTAGTVAPSGDEEETGWNAVSWGHLASQPGEAGRAELESMTYVPAGGRLLAEAWTADGIEWGKNAAHVAAATWQRPVRIAFHADDMLPEGPG